MRQMLAALLMLATVAACAPAAGPSESGASSLEPVTTAAPTAESANGSGTGGSGSDVIPLTKAATVSFSGSTNKKTKAFTVGSPLRIAYTFRGSGNFIVDLDATDGTTTATVANRIGSGSLTTWAFGGSGTGYFDVTADGAWTLTASTVAPTIAKLPATFKGNTGVITAPFAASDSMTVNWTVSGSGNFIVDLIDPTDGSTADSVANLIGNSTDTTQLYGHAGPAALDVTADGSWTMKITSP
jgi:hypothetical protein